VSVATLWDLIEGEVATLETTAPVAWPNRHWSPPGKTTNPATAAKWYALDMEFEPESTEELTFDRDEMLRGRIVLGCFTEPQVGEEPLMTLVDAARALFPNKLTSGGVVLDVLRPDLEIIGRVAGSDGADLWYGWLVIYRFMAQVG
jgi:hypothetical protein